MANDGSGGHDLKAVRKQLKDKTERVPLRALERRGFKSVQVLDMAAIERIVQEAVETAFQRREEQGSTQEREALAEEAKSEFLKLLAAHKNLQRQKTEADEKRWELEQQVQALRGEVHAQASALSDERARPVGDTSRFSREALTELEVKIRQLFKGLFREEQRRSLAEIGPRALKGLNDFEQVLAQLLDRLMEDERERFLAKERADHQQKITLLEKRLSKLNRALKSTEATLQQVAAAKSIDLGLASIYDSIQGLSLEDPNFSRKSELLKEILQQNLELQGKPASLAPGQSGASPAAPTPRARPAAAVAAVAAVAAAAGHGPSSPSGMSGSAPVAPAPAPHTPAASPPARPKLTFLAPLDTVITETAF